jgi:hypothetical protein
VSGRACIAPLMKSSGGETLAEMEKPDLKRANSLLVMSTERFDDANVLTIAQSTYPERTVDQMQEYAVDNWNLTLPNHL